MSKLTDLQKKMQQSSTTLSNHAKTSDLISTGFFTDDSESSVDISSELAAFPASYEHLPIEFKKAMIALNRLHNTPYEFGLTTLLGFANSACQHLYDVQSYKYGVRPISLYIMILLGTGGSKTTIFNELKGPLKNHEKHWYNILKDEPLRFVMEEKTYKSAIQQYEKDQLAGLSPTWPTKPQPIQTANYMQSKFTVNGLIKALSTQPHASIVSSEAGELFASHAFQGGKNDQNRATEMTTTLTKLWDGEHIEQNTGSITTKLFDRRVNSLLMVQEAVIKDVLNNKLFAEQGFTHRILIAQIELFDKPLMSFDPTVIARELQDRQLLKSYLDRLAQMLDERFNILPDTFELRPKVIYSDENAKLYFAEFYNNTMHLSKADQKLERYEGFGQRLHEQSIRIAATIAIFNDHKTITLEDAKCACAIMEMFIEHRSRLETGIVDTNPILTNATEVVLDWFKRNLDKEFSKREITQLGPNSYRKISGEQQLEILQDLLDSEKIIGLKVAANNGKEIVKYRYNKAV
jgi:hypothetical protein